MNCPFCSAVLTATEDVKGWCRTCGRKLPEIGPGSFQPAPPMPFGIPPTPPTSNGGVSIGYMVGALIFSLIGSGFLSSSIWNDGPRAPLTGRARLFEELFGARGAEVAIGVVFLGLAVLCTCVGLMAAQRREKLLWPLGVAVMLVAPIVAGFLMTQETRAEVARQQAILRKQKAIADELMPLTKGLQAPVFQGKGKLRNKLLVWDGVDNRRSAIHDSLLEERGKTAPNESCSVILIDRHIDHEEKPFSNGIRAVRRDLHFAVFDWPEKKLVGYYGVNGYGPGILITRAQGDTRPEIGDTLTPLHSWIKNCDVQP